MKYRSLNVTGLKANVGHWEGENVMQAHRYMKQAVPTVVFVQSREILLGGSFVRYRECIS